MNEFWVIGLAAVGTYLWRFLGVALAGRIHTESEFFKWISCVTYAMVAGLVFRIVILPIGLLAQVPLWARLLCIGLALAIMLWPHPRRGGMGPALLVGGLTMALCGAALDPSL